MPPGTQWLSQVGIKDLLTDQNMPFVSKLMSYLYCLLQDKQIRVSTTHKQVAWTKGSTKHWRGCCGGWWMRKGELGLPPALCPVCGVQNTKGIYRLHPIQGDHKDYEMWPMKHSIDLWLNMSRIFRSGLPGSSHHKAAHEGSTGGTEKAYNQPAQPCEFQPVPTGCSFYCPVQTASSWPSGRASNGPVNKHGP